MQDWAPKQKKGEMVIWITLEGFFWFPRSLLGIERHLYTFYDNPELMHTINRDLLEFNLQAVDKICRICTPNFMTFAEDMSYNHGPMLSKDCFDEFMVPYYQQIIPKLKTYGILPLIDSDGDVEPLIPWLEEAGIEGILPLERMAGVDVARIRKKHPKFRMIGAFDKTVMHLGAEAMRQEFERLLPVMQQGRFIPAVDHQTPPDVSLEQYRCFVSLLKEYCTKAAQHEFRG
jgi:uroporphyrinogen-III decarboxylase